MPATPRASTTMLPSSERNIVAGAMNARPQPMVAQRPTRSPCSSVIGARRRRPTTSVTVEDDSADSEEDSVDIAAARIDRKSTRLNSSHVAISYAVFCLKKKKDENAHNEII